MKLRFFTLFLIFSLHVLGQSGDPVTGFGTDGKVITTLEYGPRVRAMAVQSDGKIIVAGGTYVNSTNYGVLLIRYNTDGTLDNSFGVNGIVKQQINYQTYINAVTLQPDGKIVVGGYTQVNSGNYFDFLLARFNSDGSLDNSFNGTGYTSLNFLADSHDYIYAVAVQADGKIVVAGDATEAKQVLAVVRYNQDGTLDNNFGTNGKVTSDFGSAQAGAKALLIQADGKIVVAGSIFVSFQTNNFIVARFNPNGSLDNTFNGNGYTATDFGAQDEAYGVAMQSDGKIVTAGITGPDFAIARYNTNGTLDNSFGSNGKVTTDINKGDYAYGVSVEPDGKILVGGYSGETGSFTGQDFTLVRYNSDGSLDNGFSSDGKAILDFGGSDKAYAMATSGCRVYLAGETLQKTSTKLDVGVGAFQRDVTAAVHCPADITVNADPGQCGANVSFEVTGDGTISYDRQPGSFFPVGTTTVTATASTTCGASSCHFTITVVDAEAPVAHCKNASVTLSQEGTATLSPNAINDGSTDNCGISSISVSPSTFTTEDAGVQTVTLSVTDVHGNTSTCTAQVTVIAPAVLTTYYQDADEDGYGNPNVSISASEQPSGYVLDNTDCNDNDATINPQTHWYLDADGDHYYTGEAVISCTAPGENYSHTGLLGGGDCNDNNADIHPGAVEICGNGVDDNCDGQIDEDCAVSHTYYEDADGDGYGNPEVSTTATSQPAGYVSNNSDCDDTNADINPTTVWYLDADHDGYYTGSGVTSCTSPGDGYRYSGLLGGDDCNDNNAAIHSPVTYYRDADGDGYGNPDVTISVCATTAPEGYVTNHTDCNDNDNTVYPGAPELCDGKDNDCNGTIDDGVAAPTITCPGNITVAAPQGQCSAVVNFEASGSGTITYSQDPGTSFPVGTTTVTATATNECGRTQTCTFTVTVTGTATPSIQCPGNITVNNDAGKCGANVNFEATGDGAITYSKEPGSFFEVGTTIVTATATTACGSNHCQFTVTVVDAEAPAVQCKNASVTLNAQGMATLDAAAVNNGSTDNCGIASISVAPNNFTTADIGVQTVTLTVTDVHGNTSTCQAQVTVTGASATEPPVVGTRTYPVKEGGDGITTLNAEVKLDKAYSLPVTVQYQTSDGDAKQGEDYVAASGTLYFEPGTTSATIPISIIADKVREKKEVFYIDFFNVQNAVVDGGRSRVLIIDDDKGNGKENSDKAKDNLKVTVQPNPSTQEFVCIISSTNGEPVKYQVSDASGRVIKKGNYLFKQQSLRFGASYVQGVYVLEVMQGKERRTVKLIKL